MGCQNRDEKFCSLFDEIDEDIDLDDWVPPDADLIQKMVWQIEQYLSDENLAKDAFLLKHVRRNKMGYVNIKLLTSFKKMKHLTKDWRVTAYALRHSSKLDLNEEGNKVCRIDPVPESVLAQVPSRLLLIWNTSEVLPSTGDTSAPRRSSMETAIAILEPFGTIISVRVNRPGRELPPEVQRYGYRYPELCSQESVLVEYEDLEGAGRAYRQLSQSEGTLRAVLVGRTSKKKTSLEPGPVEERCNGTGIAILNRRMEQLQSRGEDSSACSSSESEFASSSPLHVPRFSLGQVCGSPRGSPRSSPRSSPRVLHAPLPGPRVSPLLTAEMWGSLETSPELVRRNPDHSSDSIAASGSPWVQRRKLAATQAPSLEEKPRQSWVVTKRAMKGDVLPPGVTRLPYGPDGTRGFQATIVGRGLHHSLNV